jgi:hypothetical protein
MNNLIGVSDNMISGTIHCPIVMGKENAIANGILDKGNGQYSINCTYVNLIYPDIFYTPQGYVKLNENFDNYYSKFLIGSSGTSGFTGPRGFIGKQGPMGYPGKPGLMGPPGIDGPIGPTGSMGPRGPRGLAGNNGLDGNIGITGQQGPKGPIGLQGNPGPSYIGPQGFSGYSGFVTIDFPKCKPIQESKLLMFNCPTDYWLTSIRNNNGNLSGLCCPLIVGDNNEPSTFDIGIDGNKYPNPITRFVEKTYDQKSLDSKFNISGNNYVSNNNINVLFENKKNVSIGSAQAELINDIVFFGKITNLI